MNVGWLYSEGYDTSADLNSLSAVDVEFDGLLSQDESAKLRQIVLQIVAVVIQIVLQDRMASAHRDIAHPHV